MTTLGAVVHRRREALGLSQRDLAKLIGVSNSTISRIEMDAGAHDNGTLRGLSKVLGCDYNYLLALNGQIDDQPEARSIQRAMRFMTPERVRDMMTILRTAFRDEFAKAGGDEEL